MPKVTIVTDSTATMPKDLIEKYNILVVPQVLIWGEETFLDGVDIQPDEFYRRLAEAKVLPTTSQATIATFQKTFRRLLDDNQQILAILISKHLSGTVASAIQAREATPGAPIEIVDSGTTAMATGFQVLAAARAAEQGASLDECKAIAEQASRHTGVLFAVNTLEFLHRGGRIGGGSRFLGTALNIKPILEVVNGRVEAVERVRTRKKSLQRIIDLVAERVNGKTPLRIASLHANAPTEAQQILQQATAQLNAEESFFSEVSPVIGTHTGPGTIGIAFIAGM